MQEIIPFCFELRNRIKEKTGMEWGAHKHSGMATWLSKNISATQMQAGRYLKGRNIPKPETAQKISVLLDWDYFDMVKSIIEVEKTNIELKLMVKYNKYRF